jgi:antitoxin component of MazEF toxin-antitoxin module
MALNEKIILDYIIQELCNFQETGVISGELEISKDSNLIGSNRVIKSRTFVELMLSIEEHLEEQFDLEFDWTSDKAMSGKRSPFLTVSTLVDFILGGQT